MIKYIKILALAAVTLSTSVHAESGADLFHPEDRLHFENQCRDLASDVFQYIGDKHPNPKLQKQYSQLDIAQLSVTTALLSLPTAIGGIIELTEGPQRQDLDPPVFRNNAMVVDYKWSDDGRRLIIVQSPHHQHFFSQVGNGHIVKDKVHLLAIFDNIRIEPRSSERVDYRAVKDFPLWARRTAEIDPGTGFVVFDPYTAHDGKRNINWGLYADPDTMPPPFHGWFTWHENNQLLALKERWPDFDCPQSFYFNNPREQSSAYDVPQAGGTANLEVRTTRVKHYDTWSLKGKIQFDLHTLAYVLKKTYNAGSFSYRTFQYNLKDTNYHFDNTQDIVDTLYGGPYEAQARETINKEWTWEVELPVATDYSATREKVTLDLHAPKVVTDRDQACRLGDERFFDRLNSGQITTLIEFDNNISFTRYEVANLLADIVAGGPNGLSYTAIYGTYGDAADAYIKELDGWALLTKVSSNVVAVKQSVFDRSLTCPDIGPRSVAPEPAGASFAEAYEAVVGVQEIAVSDQNPDSDLTAPPSRRRGDYESWNAWEDEIVAAGTVGEEQARRRAAEEALAVANDNVAFAVAEEPVAASFATAEEGRTVDVPPFDFQVQALNRLKGLVGAGTLELTDLQFAIAAHIVINVNVNTDDLAEMFPEHDEFDVTPLINFGLAEWVEVPIEGSNGFHDLYVSLNNLGVDAFYPIQ